MMNLIAKTRYVPGAMCEVGVFKGNSLQKIAEQAKRFNKKCYGFDTFDGMPKPGPNDGNTYPRGRFSGASKMSVKRRVRFPCILVKGIVPATLSKIKDETFSFVRLDLDHYEPTIKSLEFFWSRMTARGIICCHDYIKDLGKLATLACDDFKEPRSGVQDTTIWWEKP